MFGSSSNASRATIRKPRDEWLALKPGTHEGYVAWERAEAIRTMVSNNISRGKYHGAAKRGNALLAGLVRCRRCGHKLTVRYSGLKNNIPRYACERGSVHHGEPRCIAFGGLQVDEAIEDALLEVVAPGAVDAAPAGRGRGGHPARCSPGSAATRSGSRRVRYATCLPAIRRQRPG